MGKKIGAICMAVVIMTGAVWFHVDAVTGSSELKKEESVVKNSTSTNELLTYAEYIKEYAEQPEGKGEYEILATSYLAGTGVEVIDNAEEIHIIPTEMLTEWNLIQITCKYRLIQQVWHKFHIST